MSGGWGNLVVHETLEVIEHDAHVIDRWRSEPHCPGSVVRRTDPVLRRADLPRAVLLAADAVEQNAVDLPQQPNADGQAVQTGQAVLLARMWLVPSRSSPAEVSRASASHLRLLVLTGRPSDRHQ